MIDEVVRKIYEEDARVRQKEMEKKQEQREYIEEFQRQQAHWNAVRSRFFSKILGYDTKGRLNDKIFSLKSKDWQQKPRISRSMLNNKILELLKDNRNEKKPTLRLLKFNKILLKNSKKNKGKPIN